MYYILEAFLVGIYSSILYVLSSNFTSNFNILLFVTGFIKHFLGYLLNIHTFYCNNGYACSKINKNLGSVRFIAVTDRITLFLESIIEGIIFLGIGWVLSFFTSYRLLIIFLIGFLLHIISELLYIHDTFCNTKCILRKI
jgi:hypothetical protein